jgi:hypothetical protein
MLDSKTRLNVFKSVSKSCWPLAACPHCWPKNMEKPGHVGNILETYWVHIGDILEADYWRDKLERQNIGENY